MTLDVVEIGGGAETRDLIEVTGISPQVLELGEPLPIAVEGAVVSGVEAHQRHPQAHVGIGDVVTQQEAAGGEPLLNTVQGREEFLIGLLVGLLGAGEATAVDAIVDRGEDMLVEGIDLLALLDRVEIGGVGGLQRSPLHLEVGGELRVVIVDHLASRDLDDGRQGGAAGEPWVSRQVCLTQLVDAEHRVEAGGVEVELPPVLAADRVDHTDADGSLQPQHLSHDQLPMRPRAQLADDEAVASGLDGKLARCLPEGRGEPIPLAPELPALAGLGLQMVIEGLVVIR